MFELAFEGLDEIGYCPLWQNASSWHVQIQTDDCPPRVCHQAVEEQQIDILQIVFKTFMG